MKAGHIDFKERARKLNTDLPAVFLALKKKETPVYAKILAGVTILYALSPIDLIPDFIPVLGYLDDLIIIPAGIWLAVRLVPREVLDDCRTMARNAPRPPANRIAGAIVIALWLLAAGWLCLYLLG